MLFVKEDRISSKRPALFRGAYQPVNNGNNNRITSITCLAGT